MTFPLRLKNKWRHGLIGKPKPNPLHRPIPPLISPPSIRPTFNRGMPVFTKQFDILNTSMPACRRYRPPFKGRIIPKTDYTPSDWHEMTSRFRFSVTGNFQNEGKTFERDLEVACKDLFIVGWIKCRSTFATGHVQGDVISLNYLKRWIDTNESDGGTIDSVHYYDENYSLEKLDYVNLRIVRDLRKPMIKQKHEKEKRERLNALIWSQGS